MKKVIISGASGFLGTSLMKELIAHDIEVIALVRKKSEGCLLESEKVKYILFSMDNLSVLKEQLFGEHVDVFFHFAWSGVSGANRTDYKVQLENIKDTMECLYLARDVGCKRFVYAGSIMELEAIRAGLQTENKPGMGYIYGIGKLAAHIMCKALAVDLGIEFVCAMITNAYGVGEKSARMVNSTIRKCIKGEIPHFTEGTQNYDFVYIDDVVRALRLIGEKGKAFGEYMIGSSDAKPLKHFLLEMKQAIAPELDFEFGEIPYTGVNQPLEDFDCSNTEKDIGFKAEISFGEGCKRTKDWLMKSGTD